MRSHIPSIDVPFVQIQHILLVVKTLYSFKLVFLHFSQNIPYGSFSFDIVQFAIDVVLITFEVLLVFHVGIELVLVFLLFIFF